MDNVIPMFGEIQHDEPAELYLKKVAENNPLDKVIVIGQTEGGSLFLGSSTGNMETLSWLMLRANAHMAKIAGCFEHEDEGLLP
jgi:hypothetical protein